VGSRRDGRVLRPELITHSRELDNSVAQPAKRRLLEQRIVGSVFAQSILMEGDSQTEGELIIVRPHEIERGLGSCLEAEFEVQVAKSRRRLLCIHGC
jgi:hypothetical protein